MRGERREAVAPLGGAADKFFALCSPRGVAHEPVPSGAPKITEPPAMGWFFLAVMTVAVVLVFAWLSWP